MNFKTLGKTPYKRHFTRTHILSSIQLTFRPEVTQGAHGKSKLVRQTKFLHPLKNFFILTQPDFIDFLCLIV